METSHPQPKKMTNSLINISLRLTTGTVVLSHSILCYNLLAATSHVTSSSLLIMTISLIISVSSLSLLAFCRVTFICHRKCYEHTVCSLTDGISFPLTERRLPAYGRDTNNCRSCVLWRSASVAAHLLVSLSVKQDVLLWNWLVRFIWRFALIGGSLGLFSCEYNMAHIMLRLKK